MKLRNLLPCLALSCSISCLAATKTVHVFNFDFGEAPPVHSDPIIELGDTIHWVWDGGIHTVTAASGFSETFDSGVKGVGGTYDHTFTNLGSFSYFCGLHGFDLGGGAVSGMSGRVIVATSNPTVSVNIVRGLLVGGNLASVQASDDNYFVVQKGFVLNATEAPIQVTFKSITANLAPTTLAIQFEDGVNASILSRRLEVFNFSTNSFSQVDLATAQLQDKITQIKLTGNLSNFINQATGEILVKLSYFAGGPISNSAFQARFDRVVLLTN